MIYEWFHNGAGMCFGNDYQVLYSTIGFRHNKLEHLCFMYRIFLRVILLYIDNIHNFFTAFHLFIT